MKICFFELEGWEEPYLNERLPRGHTYEFKQHTVSDADKSSLADCDILTTFIFSMVKAPLIELAPKLKLIATRSTGFDHIDRGAAAKRNIAVANVPEYGSNTVAEHTMALLLALSRRVIPAYVRTKAGQFSTQGLRGFDLRNKVMGIIGTGNIGLHVIRMARSFGMRVVAFDPYPRNTLADVIGFEYIPLDELLKCADVVSLHCPATKENEHLICAETIAKMKRGAVLLNTARGSLVNTRDLLQALESKHISGAGLDVFDGEVALKEDAASQADRGQTVAAIEAYRLLTREDVIVTPHNAFNSEEAVRRILDTTCENIRTFIDTGKPAFPIPAIK